MRNTNGNRIISCNRIGGNRYDENKRSSNTSADETAHPCTGHRFNRSGNNSLWNVIHWNLWREYLCTNEVSLDIKAPALSFSLPGGGPAAAAEGGAVPTACCRFESNSATNHIKIAAYNQHTGTSSEYRGIASVAVQLVSHDERPRLRRTQSGPQPGRVSESGSESGGGGRPGGARPIARAAARARLGHSPALTGPKSQASH